MWASSIGYLRYLLAQFTNLKASNLSELLFRNNHSLYIAPCPRKKEEEKEKKKKLSKYYISKDLFKSCRALKKTQIILN